MLLLQKQSHFRKCLRRITSHCRDTSAKQHTIPAKMWLKMLLSTLRLYEKPTDYVLDKVLRRRFLWQKWYFQQINTQKKVACQRPLNFCSQEPITHFVLHQCSKQSHYPYLSLLSPHTHTHTHKKKKALARSSLSLILYSALYTGRMYVCVFMFGLKLRFGMKPIYI